jgi:CIC family chloride channel protein
MAESISTVQDRLADFTRDKRILLLSIFALVIGIISALVAKALVWLIAVITNIIFFQTYATEFMPLTHHHLGAWVIGVPAIGGLIIGLMARYGTDKIRGHGIPEALEAILFGQSRMSLKVALLKPISSAISIGTGGPFGAEGPIIMTGGAFGSLFAQCFNLSSGERKTLLVAGAAAGMAAIFATPVGAVLLAIELLLFEWRPRSFIPVAIAAAAAAALRIPLMGLGPIFPVTLHQTVGPETLPFAFLVGLIAGFGSSFLTWLVYQVEDGFHRLPIHWMWWPAIGGLIVGLLGWQDPRVLGVGYTIIHQLLQGEMLSALALGLLLSKTIAWTVALGSGTSGGVLAPLLMLGGALGIIEANLIPVGDAGMWATISMAAMMGGTMRSPLTGMIFLFELTNDGNLLLPLMVGSTAAYLVTVLLMRRSILTEKIARRGYHIIREYSTDPLSLVRAEAVMDTEVSTIPASMPIQALWAALSLQNPDFIKHKGIPITDEEGQLVGIITHGDISRKLQEEPESKASVLEVGSSGVIVAYPDEPLNEILYRLIKNNIGRLPVVSRENPRQVVGYLGRSAVINARSRQVEEELLEQGGLWFTWPFSKSAT